MTGDCKVEMLEGPTVGGADKVRKFKFNQLTKVVVEEPRAEKKKKEVPDRKANDAARLMELLKKNTEED